MSHSLLMALPASVDAPSSRRVHVVSHAAGRANHDGDALAQPALLSLRGKSHRWVKGSSGQRGT